MNQLPCTFAAMLFVTSAWAVGDVVGPAAATNNAVARFDGPTGKVIKNSTATISDAGLLDTSEISTHRFTLGAPAMLGGQNLLQTQSYTGTSLATVGENMNMISTTADDAAMDTDHGINFLNNFRIEHQWGGPAMKGGRQSFFVDSDQEGGPSSSANNNRNYVSISAWMNSSSGDGGTGLTPASAKGAYFALSPAVFLRSGATNVLEAAGAEFNVAVESGASVYYKTLLSLVGHSTDAVHGTRYDAMLSLSNQGGVAWNDGILFSAANASHPIAASGTLVRTEGGNFANGIDLSDANITGSPFKSSGFRVDGAGSVNGNHGVFNEVTIGGNGQSAYLYSSPSTDLYFGTQSAKVIYFVTNNTIRGAMSSNGSVEFNAGINNTSIGTAIPNSGSFSSLRVVSAPPGSANSVGTAGTITWDSNYLYVCVAANTWKRLALSSW